VPPEKSHYKKPEISAGLRGNYLVLSENSFLDVFRNFRRTSWQLSGIIREQFSGCFQKFPPDFVAIIWYYPRTVFWMFPEISAGLRGIFIEMTESKISIFQKRNPNSHFIYIRHISKTKN
jgi:hypothetical protein